MNQTFRKLRLLFEDGWKFVLLLAPLKVDSMMYPRLMFSDNMEDKGLTEDRAIQFQWTDVRMLKEYETKCLKLDTVGVIYTGDKKALKNV